MIVSRIPDSEALASTVWSLAADECRLCHLALMWLVLNQRRLSGGADSLIDVCQRLKDSGLAGAPREPRTSDAEMYARMVDMARSVLLGETMDPTSGAWKIHRHSELPAWSRGVAPTALIGPYLFYAPDTVASRASAVEPAD